MSKQAGNALISVFDKKGIEEFASNLAEMGWKVFASGGTFEAIKKAGVSVIDTSEISGGGSILNHRVVTLSREIYAGILADKTPAHDQELAKLNIPRIDLVCVDMYPLKKAINDPKASEQSVIELTDIGGPTLLHAAAKGRRIVVSKETQRPEVVEWLKAGKPNEKEFLHSLAAAAEYKVAEYLIDSANYLGGEKVAGFIGERVAEPNYGENPWQRGAGLFIPSHTDDPLSIANFNLIEGIELSYNNYTDVDRLLQTITHVAGAFDRNFKSVPAIALGAKHGNLCGAGVNENPLKAIQNMLDGDIRAIFGGSVIINCNLSLELAEAIMTYKQEKGKRILDIVMAPSVDDDALDLLKRKNGKLRVFINSSLGSLTEASMDQTKRTRHVRGGRLRQDNYTFIFDYSLPEFEQSGKEVTKTQSEDMLIAWAVGSTSNSNAITIVKNGRLLSNGVGQQDRVTSAELALMRARNAGHDIAGASAYSDSFFPFPDGPQILADAGVSAILTTRGSIRDQEIIDVLTKAGVSFCTLPDRMARGFFAH